MVLDPVLHKRSSYAFGHLCHRRPGGRNRRRGFRLFGNPGTAFGGMLVVDGFATFFRMLVMSVGILTVLPSYRFPGAPGGRNQRVSRAAALFHRRPMPDGGRQRPDHCLHRAGDFLHRELRAGRLSARRQARPTKPPLKYFLLGSFATAFFLYGVAHRVRRHRNRESQRGARRHRRHRSSRW